MFEASSELASVMEFGFKEASDWIRCDPTTSSRQLIYGDVMFVEVILGDAMVRFAAITTTIDRQGNCQNFKIRAV